MKLDIFNQILGAAAKAGASDVHLKVDSPPIFRMRGKLRFVKAPRLSAEDTEAITGFVLHQIGMDKPVINVRELDASYAISNVGRFRVNIFRQRGSLAAIFRVIPVKVPKLDELGAPEILKQIALTHSGIIILAGAPGSGKTTTMASVIQYINQHRSSHILTIENPIEYYFRDEKSTISQREIGPDTTGYTESIHSALRQDSDVLALGDMVDRETIELAVRAAEAGRLVLTTISANDAMSTLKFLIGSFPAGEEESIRRRLADSLVSILSQRLVKREDGSGRAMIMEVCRNNSAISRCILDPALMNDLNTIIEENNQESQSQTFDQHILELVHNGVMDAETARKEASNPSIIQRITMIESR